MKNLYSENRKNFLILSTVIRTTLIFYIANINKQGFSSIFSAKITFMYHLIFYNISSSWNSSCTMIFLNIPCFQIEPKFRKGNDSHIMKSLDLEIASIPRHWFKIMVLVYIQVYYYILVYFVLSKMILPLKYTNGVWIIWG